MGVGAKPVTLLIPTLCLEYSSSQPQHIIFTLISDYQRMVPIIVDVLVHQTRVIPTAPLRSSRHFLGIPLLAILQVVVQIAERTDAI